MERQSVIPDGSLVRTQSGRIVHRRSYTPPPIIPSAINHEAQTSKQSSSSNSVTPSPRNSRDTSPSRPARRAASTNRIMGTRSHQNSQQDNSPSRTRPSYAAPTSTTLARTLSSPTTPTLLPASQESQVYAPTPQKPIINPELSPRWPVSPRLRSPPLLSSKPGNTYRIDQEPPIINVQRPSPSPYAGEPRQTTPDSEPEDPHSGLRTPVRSSLETVQEVSQPNSPSRTTSAALIEKVKERLANSENRSDSALSNGHTFKPRPNMAGPENGIDTTNNRTDARRPTSVPPPLLSRQSSSAMSSKQAKSKHEGSTQTMTVETETVPSVPSVALVTGPKIEGSSGTLKPKPSTETIKPRKEKKSSRRKQPAVNAGNASSKADIFEAKIASAVDEANTSDSEETFVYDSNPPDTNDRAGRRFHSRTPSATSMASTADRQNLRSIYGIIDNGPGPAPAPKRNMKFVNTFTNGGDSLAPGDDDGRGSIRSGGGGSARGTARHHHIGRWGRQPGLGHQSLFDTESPFPNAARSKMTSNGSRTSSGPPSPRNYHHSPRGPVSNKRSPMQMSSNYDLDDTTGADDERTPLVGSNRSVRSSRNRRGPHNLRQQESQTFEHRSSYLNRFAACLVLNMMMMLVITGAIGFMFATSQPMTDIELVSIQNVVTSEQVLMFDLTVKAHNPNIVVVTIDHANLEIFAKSEHAGTDSDWWKHPHSPDELHQLDDPVNDPPIDDGDGTKPNVLLGRITEFDSSLTFEGSLFHQGTSESTGGMQLEYPGNKTSGGSKRWERIYQNEFDLIVKGVVKYSLPLSAHIRSATLSGRTTVKPNSASDPSDTIPIVDLL